MLKVTMVYMKKVLKLYFRLPLPQEDLLMLNEEEIERINQVEVSKQYPILIMVNEEGKIQWILDGNHRAQKSLQSRIKNNPS
jgi:hypothetical protein